MVAVADVHHRARPVLAGRSTADGMAGLDHQGAQTALGEVGGAGEPVVPTADHDGIEVS